MYIVYGKEVFEKKVDDVIYHDVDKYADSIKILREKLSAMVTLLHSKGVISDDEIYDLGGVPEAERFKENEVRYTVEWVAHPDTYKLVKSTIGFYTNGELRDKLVSKDLATGTLAGMEELAAALRS